MNDEFASGGANALEGQSLALPTPLPADCAFDFEKYRADTDAFALSDEQARELLETLWSIMASFVHLGFGVDSVQIFLDSVPHAASDSRLGCPDTEAPDANGPDANARAGAFNCVANNNKKKGES